MIEITGEGKSAVATPDGTSRKKKKKNYFIGLIKYKITFYAICKLLLCSTPTKKLSHNNNITLYLVV